MKFKLNLIPLLSIPFIAISCKNNQKPIQEENKIENKEAEANNKQDEIKIYHFIDFYNSSKINNKQIFIDNDLQASNILNGYIFYEEYKTVDDTGFDEDADLEITKNNVHIFKISSFFNKDFFKENILIYTSEIPNLLTPNINNVENAKIFFPIKIENGKFVYDDQANIIEKNIEKVRNFKFNLKHINYIHSSVKGFYIAINKKHKQAFKDFVNKIYTS